MKEDTIRELLIARHPYSTITIDQVQRINHGWQTMGWLAIYNHRRMIDEPTMGNQRCCFIPAQGSLRDVIQWDELLG